MITMINNMYHKINLHNIKYIILTFSTILYSNSIYNNIYILYVLIILYSTIHIFYDIVTLYTKVKINQV